MEKSEPENPVELCWEIEKKKRRDSCSTPQNISENYFFL